MILENKFGHVLEVLPPDCFGKGAVIFNGKVSMEITYSDGGISVHDGPSFANGKEFASYIADKAKEWTIETLERGVREAQKRPIRVAFKFNRARKAKKEAPNGQAG